MQSSDIGSSDFRFIMDPFKYYLINNTETIVLVGNEKLQTKGVATI